MSIADELAKNDKKGLFRSDDSYIMYSTGILPLDYANGYWQQVTINGEKKMVPMVGITGGTFVTIIGTTGTGKTTFAEQLAYNIIRPFEYSTMHHIDAEKTTNRQRIIQLSGARYDDPRIRLHKAHTSIEDVLEMVTRICEMKKEGDPKDFMYEIQDKSYDGKPMKVYIPTVFIIDSLPQFNSNNYNTDDLGNNIDQMKAAKDTTRFFTNCVDRAWEYNITFIIVNHIRPKADMNPYAAPPKGLLMLGPQETLPRGAVAQYYSNTFFRINTKKSDQYTIEENGFTGYKCMFQLAKSKTNQIGTSFPVAFRSDRGFDPVYTLYEFASSIGLIKGRNPYLYFEGLDTFKFNRKDFINKMGKEKDFRENVLLILKPYLEGLLGSKTVVEPDGDWLPYGDLTLPE